MNGRDACLVLVLAVLMGAVFPNRPRAADMGVAGPAKRQALPYFASLKQAVTNVRVGPGRDYPIRWVYKKRGLPVEVLATYGNWRRIRAGDGGEGWVAGILLSPRRTALVDPWSDRPVDLRASARKGAAIAARLQPRVLVGLQWCDRVWCAVRIPGREESGYIRQTQLWGVYPDETIPDRSMWGRVRSLL